MGVLLMAEAASYPRLVASKSNAAVEANNNVAVHAGVKRCASSMIESQQQQQQEQRLMQPIQIAEKNDWVPPPPKKKWIRHYLLEEEPLENTRLNGTHPLIQQQQHGLRGVLSPPIGSSPPTSNSGTNHMTLITASQLHQIDFEAQQQHHQQQQHNHFLDNQNSNSSSGGNLYVDIETVHDNKKPRNGPCVIRSGTREVHNKLEKNRRAHLKECFEMLKKQLPSQDEKKSSNLSILHAAIRHIQGLKRKERDYEHEMERLAREKITAQQRLVSLKKELLATWDHIDLNTILPEHNSPVEPNIVKSEAMEVDTGSGGGGAGGPGSGAGSGGLARGGTRYSSTSSLSSAATASSPQNMQQQHHQSGASQQPVVLGSSPVSQQQQVAATAAVVSQTQGLNLAQSSVRDSPPAAARPKSSSPPGATVPATSASTVTLTLATTVPTPTSTPMVVNSTTANSSSSGSNVVTTVQEKYTISPSVVQQHQITQPQQQQQQTTPTQLHLPISAQMLNTSQGLATLMPTLQHLGPGIKLMNDGRQLIAVQSNGTVGGGSNGEARPVALVVHSSTSANNDNRVTFVHSANGDRPLTLAVQSSTGNEVRPVTFVSGNEARPIVLTATHAPTINVTSAQTRIRTGDSTQTTHKMVGGVTLVGGTGGTELARLPGGAELNILPANSIFRSVKAQPLTVQGGLTLSHAGVSLQATKSTPTPVSLSQSQQRHQTTTNNGHVSPSTGQSQQPQTDNLPANCHLVAQSSLTPLVAGPMTVVSQGSNGSPVILAPSSLAGKMIAGTPLLKSVGQGHLPIAAQYINNLVKPVVVVSSNHQQQSQAQQVTANNGVAVSSQSAV